MNIFLSFSFRYQAQAEILAERLRALDTVDDVFLSSETLIGGQRWLEQLQARIHDADAFVFMLGEYVGNWQRLEFADAFDRKIAEDAERESTGRPSLPLVPLIFEPDAPATLLRRDARGVPFVQRLHLIVDPDAFPRRGSGFDINLATLQQIARGLSGEAQAATQLWRTINPYRGLLALREQDADFLFGRDIDVVNILTAIAEQPAKLLLALGGSGVGKSSLVFAGVFAALERQTLPGGATWPAVLADCRSWPRLALTPGTEPVRNLAGAFLSQWLKPTTAAYHEEADAFRKLLTEGGSIERLIEAADAGITEKSGCNRPPRYLLYVDQGEELYTRAGRDSGRDGTSKEKIQEKEARRFSELLAEGAAHPRLTVIMSVRSDFLDRLQADQPIHNSRHLSEIAPLDESSLNGVVQQPAHLLGVAFEPGLDNALVASTREEEGGLPLLSDTLDILWKEMQDRGDGVLKWTTPNQTVNVARKLAERADAFVAANKHQESAIQRLFCVRLAHVPNQGAATRQTFYLDDTDVSSAELQMVAELSGQNYRILSAGSTSLRDDGSSAAETNERPYTEIAHEALFTAWDTLKSWLATHRGYYAWVTEISRDRREWEESGRLKKALLTGRPLERARGYLQAYSNEIPEADLTFVQKSVSHHQSRKIRGKLSVAAAMLFLLLSSGFAVSKWLEAERLLLQAEMSSAQASELARALAKYTQAPNGNASQYGGVVVQPVQLPGEFSSSGSFELLEDGRFRVLTPIIFKDHNGVIWQAPRGFVSDGMSLPRPFWLIYGTSFQLRAIRASIIHDYYCVSASRTWKDTHKMLYVALVSSGVSEFNAKLFYNAVYHFGPRWN